MFHFHSAAHDLVPVFADSLLHPSEPGIYRIHIASIIPSLLRYIRTPGFWIGSNLNFLEYIPQT